MTKHTPGPWAVNDGQEVVADDGAGTRLLCRCHAGHYEERSANARLIAAAPDLLAALKVALEYQGAVNEALPDGYAPPKLVDAWMTEAEAAIARAEGRE